MCELVCSTLLDTLARKELGKEVKEVANGNGFAYRVAVDLL